MTLILLLVLTLVKSSPVHAMKKTYTGNKTIDYIAESMIKSAGVKESMSDDAKVKKIYHYMTWHFKHTHAGRKKYFKVYYSKKKIKKQINAYNALVKKMKKKGRIKVDSKYSKYEWNMMRRVGSCIDIAAMFAILCRHEGIKADTHRGYYKNRNGSRPSHSWNYAYVNGKKYYYDVDVEIKNRGGGQGDYYWYKKTYSQAKKTHKF